MRQLFEVFKQPFLIFGDAQIPLLKLFLLNRAVASPAAAINKLPRSPVWLAHDGHQFTLDAFL